MAKFLIDHGAHIEGESEPRILLTNYGVSTNSNSTVVDSSAFNYAANDSRVESRSNVMFSQN